MTAALALGLFAACGSSPAPPAAEAPLPTLTIGVATSTDVGYHPPPGQPCVASRRHNDVRVGVPVVVRDGRGEVIATSQLEPGTLADAACVFFAEVRDLARADFYSFDVGGHQGVTKSYAELLEARWQLGITISG